MNTIGKVTSTRCIARRPRLPRLGSAEPQPERHLSSCQLPARAKLQSAQVLKPRRVPGRTEFQVAPTPGSCRLVGRDSSMCPAAPVPDSQCVALDWSTRHSVQVSRETCPQWLQSGALTNTCRAAHFRFQLRCTCSISGPIDSVSRETRAKQSPSSTPSYPQVSRRSMSRYSSRRACMLTEQLDVVSRET